MRAPLTHGGECTALSELVDFRAASNLQLAQRLKVVCEREGLDAEPHTLSTLATLAEHPVAIRKCFLNREYSSRGKYRVRLYDGLKRQWVIIVIDDYIPVKKGTKDPIFVKPNGEELWAMLLEKAFAKFYGSYAKLSGGQEIGALFQITGDNCFSFRSVPETKKDDGNYYSEVLKVIKLK